MSDSNEYQERNIDLPAGCKDLIDVIGKSRRTTVSNWRTAVAEELAHWKAVWPTFFAWRATSTK